MAIEEILQNSNDTVTSYNIIAQNTINNSYSGGINILGTSRNVLVECNKITNSGQEVYPDVYIGTRQGLAISGKGGTFRYNIIHNSKSDGILLEGRVYAGVQLFAESNLIYQNTVVGNGRSGLYMGIKDNGNQTGTNAYIRNNLIENNIFWNNIGNDSVNGTNGEIVVNFYNANAPWGSGFTDGNLFRFNNVSNIPAYHFVGAGASGNFVKNTVFDLQAHYPAWINNKQQDPLFATNFYLSPSSPMIDAGATIPGVSYNGAAPDLGAIEYGSAPPPTSQQAIVFNGINQYGIVNLPNSSPFNSLGGFQVIWRVRNAGTNAGRIFSSGFGGLVAYNGSMYIFFDGRNEQTNLYMTPTNYTDSICKLQFDPANSRWTFETWKADGTGYVASTVPTTNSSNFNLGGSSIALGASVYNSLHLQEKIDYWGWIERVEPLGADKFPGTSLPIGVNYLLKYEFDGNGTDSSGRGLHLNLVNSPTFETTP